MVGPHCSNFNCINFSVVGTFRNFKVYQIKYSERLALLTLDHGVSGLNPAGGEILGESKQHFIAQSPSRSSFLCPDMTEILFKGP